MYKCTSSKIISIIAITLTWASSAFSAILVDPELGGSFGSSSQEYAQNGGNFSVETSSSGITFGGRVGLDFVGFMFGLDLQGGPFGHTTESTVTLAGTQTVTATSNSSPTLMQGGLFAGYSFPALLRVWGSYFPLNHLKSNASTLKGYAYTLGIGLTFLPVISLNLKYGVNQYTEAETSAGTTVSYSGGQVLEFRMFMASISVPLTF